MSLEKHVNGHFNTQDIQNASKRSSDPPQPKKTKKDHKKIKCRRQPWSGNNSLFNQLLKSCQFRRKFHSHSFNIILCLKYNRRFFLKCLFLLMPSSINETTVVNPEMMIS